VNIGLNPSVNKVGRQAGVVVLSSSYAAAWESQMKEYVAKINIP
jgi:hypothetical protein